MQATDLCSEGYAKQLLALHTEREDFGKGSVRWALPAYLMCQMHGLDSVLDYGCGKAEVALHLPMPVACYDPAIPKFYGLPEPADLVICCDVLEHIEPDKLSAVLGHLRSVTRRFLLVNINCQPASKRLSDGRNAHLIVEPPAWWLDTLCDVGFCASRVLAGLVVLSRTTLHVEGFPDMYGAYDRNLCADVMYDPTHRPYDVTAILEVSE